MHSKVSIGSSDNHISLMKKTHTTDAKIEVNKAARTSNPKKRKLADVNTEQPQAKKVYSPGIFETEDFKSFEINYFIDNKDTITKAPLLLAADLCKINYFFHQLPLLNEGLAKLDAEIAENLKKKNISVESFVSGFSKRDYKCHRSLSQSLKKWLITSNFSHEVETVITELSKKEFFSLLKNKTMFKDVGIDPFHGEWSHFIQWYLVANNQELIHSLNFPPHVIIQMLGDNDNNVKGKDTLWDLTFDSFKEKPSFNFTSPENITQFLKKKLVQFPFLSANIQKRFLKRITVDLRDESDSESDTESDNGIAGSFSTSYPISLVSMNQTFFSKVKEVGGEQIHSLISNKP